MNQQPQIPRPVDILIGYPSIVERFGVGKSRVKSWVEHGAPIILDDKGTPRTEAFELWVWIRSFTSLP